MHTIQPTVTINCIRMQKRNYLQLKSSIKNKSLLTCSSVNYVYLTKKKKKLIWMKVIPNQKNEWMNSRRKFDFYRMKFVLNEMYFLFLFFCRSMTLVCKVMNLLHFNSKVPIDILNFMKHFQVLLCLVLHYQAIGCLLPASEWILFENQ